MLLGLLCGTALSICWRDCTHEYGMGLVTCNLHCHSVSYSASLQVLPTGCSDTSLKKELVQCSAFHFSHTYPLQLGLIASFSAVRPPATMRRTLLQGGSFHDYAGFGSFLAVKRHVYDSHSPIGMITDKESDLRQSGSHATGNVVTHRYAKPSSRQ